jgi:hypothetical protein
MKFQFQSWWIALAIALTAAGVRYWRSPSSAAELFITPDEVEPVVSAQRLVTLGQYNLAINGKLYPQRYPPLFSMLLLPAYLVAPRNLGAGIVVVWMFAVAGVGFTFAVARQLAGNLAGALAAAALLLNPLPARHAAHIVTDVPAAALGVATCWLFLKSFAVSVEHPNGAAPAKTRILKNLLVIYFLAGLTIAVAAGLRPPMAMLIFPWLGAIAITPGHRLSRLSAILIAPLTLAICTAFYQSAEFGDWRRSGYQVWCPVPYDYPSLLFSAKYLTSNLVELTDPGLFAAIVAGSIAAIILCRTRAALMRAMLLYLAAGALPISGFFLLYCFPYARFHDLALYLFSALAGAGLATLMLRVSGGRQVGWMIAIAGALVSPLILTAPPSATTRRDLARAIAARTPQDAVIITGVDEPYLEPAALRGTQRTVLPYHRTANYAGSLIAWKRIADPRPTPSSFVDHRCPGLLRGGAVEVYDYTAMESPEKIAQLLQSGRTVYFDLSSAEPQHPGWRALFDRVWLEPVEAAPMLSRLVLRRP